MEALLAAQMKKGGDAGKLDMKKYERMKKMGMPMNSILNRMKMDGASDSQIGAFGGSAVKKAKAVDDKQIMPKSVKPSQRLKPFHWAKINSHQTDKTIWKGAEDEMASICKTLDFSELDALFSREKETATKRAATKKKEARNQLIDPKREQNVMIGLAQIKMSEDDLLDAILKMDDKVRSLSLSLSVDCHLQ